MPYVLLGLAIVSEVTATLSLRASAGFSHISTAWDVWTTPARPAGSGAAARSGSSCA